MKKVVIILSVVAVIGIGAYFFYDNQINKLEDMKYKLIGINFDQASLTENTIANLTFQITSDSTLEALVNRLDLDVLIDGRKIGVITNINPFVIPAKGYSNVDLKVTTNLLQAGETVLGLAGQIAASKDAMITFKGTADIKSAFITFKSIKIDYSDSIKKYI